MPTAIHEIHGNVPPNELADRGKAIGAYSGYVPMSNLTSGEFRLHLIYKELNAMELMYPESRDLIRKAKSLIDNAIWRGLHKGGHKAVSVGSLHSPLLQSVARSIYTLKDRRTPAMRQFSSRPSAFHIGEPIIPQRQGCTPPPFSQATGNFETPMQWINYWNSTHQSTINQCKFEGLVNEHLEKASPHVLYEFLPEIVHPNQAPNLVATKYFFQNSTVTDLNDVGKVWKRSDLVEWVRLGVKLSNAKNGAGLLTPKESILALIENPDVPGVNSPRVGFPILAIIAAIVAAIPAITGMIVAIKASNRGNDDAALRMVEFMNTGRIASRGSSPNTTDWGGGYNLPPGANTETDPLTNSNIPLLLAAAAGIYLITQK